MWHWNLNLNIPFDTFSILPQASLPAFFPLGLDQTPPDRVSVSALHYLEQLPGRRCWQSSLVSEKPDSMKFKIYVYFGINQKWFILWVSSRPVNPKFSWVSFFILSSKWNHSVGTGWLFSYIQYLLEAVTSATISILVFLDIGIDLTNRVYN